MHFRPRFVWCRLYSFAYGNAAVRTFGRARRHRPYGFVWVDCVWEGWFRLGGLRANGHFICVGLRGKILRSVVGAVPVCPPVSPHQGRIHR